MTGPREWDQRRTESPPTILPPAVVASSGVQRGLTAAVAAATFHVPERTGVYRATAVIRCTTGGDAINAVANVVHTDPVGTATQAVATLSLAATGRTSGSLLFEAQAGTVVQYSVTLSGARVASVYEFQTQLERMTP